MTVMNHLLPEDEPIRVLDLFSAAAGGWSLGMHRAGFKTMAACEVIDWRRAIYSENNPGVPVYDDVTTLTAGRLVRDGHGLPDIIVGSPPCQDISSANTKGKGVDGERSSLYFEAVRLIDECRPRWFALENSSNLRTRGADRVIDALAAIGYTCWPFVVSAGDVGANHERKRSWLVGFSVADADGDRRAARREGWWSRFDVSLQGDTRDASQDGCGQGRPWGYPVATEGLSVEARGDAGSPANTNGHAVRLTELSQRPKQEAAITGDATEAGTDADPSETERRSDAIQGSDRDGQEGKWAEGADRYAEHSALCTRNPANANEAGQENGRLEPSTRPAPFAGAGCGCERSDDWQSVGQVGGGTDAGQPAAEPWSDWNSGLAYHLRVDDGLSGWVAKSRIAVGGPRGTVAASLIVEAFGDAVAPQIPEAIGRAILRVERALAAVANDNYPSASSTATPIAANRSHA